MFELRARSWTAKPTSTRRLEAETTLLQNEQDRLRRQIRDEERLLREQERIAAQSRALVNRHANIGYHHRALDLAYPSYGHSYAMGTRPRAISQQVYGGRRIADNARAHDLALQRELLRRRNIAGLSQQEHMLSRERDMLRMQELEDLRYRNNAIGGYGLSPRELDYESNSFGHPVQYGIDDVRSRRSSLATPYAGYEAFTPYERLANLEPPAYTPRSTQLDMALGLETPYSRRFATPRMGSIDPVLY